MQKFGKYVFLDLAKVFDMASIQSYLSTWTTRPSWTQLSILLIGSSV